MKISIEISNFSKLRKKTEFFIFCSTKQEYIECKRRGLQTLPSLKNNNKKKFFNFRDKTIKLLQKTNPENEIFLSSPLGCNNISQSDFLYALENYFKVKILLRQKKEIKILLFNECWYFFLINFLKERNFSVHFNSKDYLKLKSSIYLKKLFIFLKFYRCFRYMIDLVLPFKNHKENLGNIDIIFFSVWSKNTIINYKKNNEDPFFSNMPLLANQKKKVVIFPLINNFDEKDINEIKKIKNIRIVSFFNILKLSDIFKILFSITMHNTLIPKSLKKMKSLIYQDLKNTIWTQSCEALMVKYCLIKLYQFNYNLKIIHSYEGNSWEKGCNMYKKNKVLGYQHTGITLAMDKLKFSHPFNPDTVITTGPKTKEILINKFQHKKNVISGCSLRNNDILKLKPKTRIPDKFKKILILMQGDNFDYLMYEKIKNINKNHNFKISIRPHPSNFLKFPSNKNMIVSKKNNVSQDIFLSDLVLYNRTSAVFNSVALGVPSVFINLFDDERDDPLWEVKNNILSRKLGNESSLNTIISYLNKNRNTFKTDLLKIRKYIKSYYFPASSNTKRKFLSKILN